MNSKIRLRIVLTIDPTSSWIARYVTREQQRTLSSAQIDLDSPLKRFVHVTSKENTIRETCDEIEKRFPVSYPGEGWVLIYFFYFAKLNYSSQIQIVKFRDKYGCDIDFGYKLEEVFKDYSTVVLLVRKVVNAFDPEEPVTAAGGKVMDASQNRARLAENARSIRKNNYCSTGQHKVVDASQPLSMEPHQGVIKRLPPLEPGINKQRTQNLRKVLRIVCPCERVTPSTSCNELLTLSANDPVAKSLSRLAESHSEINGSQNKAWKESDNHVCTKLDSDETFLASQHASISPKENLLLQPQFYSDELGDMIKRFSPHLGETNDIEKGVVKIPQVTIKKELEDVKVSFGNGRIALPITGLTFRKSPAAKDGQKSENKDLENSTNRAARNGNNKKCCKPVSLDKAADTTMRSSKISFNLGYYRRRKDASLRLRRNYMNREALLERLRENLMESNH